LQLARYLEVFLDGTPPACEIRLWQQTILDAPTAQPIMSVQPRSVTFSLVALSRQAESFIDEEQLAEKLVIGHTVKDHGVQQAPRACCLRIFDGVRISRSCGKAPVSPGFHNLLQFLVRLLGFIVGAFCGGLFLLAASLIPLANETAKFFVLMSTVLLAWLCAAGGAASFTKMFRATVFAKCPKCGGKATAETGPSLVFVVFNAVF
jgi:hypothetical protein